MSNYQTNESISSVQSSSVVQSNAVTVDPTAQAGAVISNKSQATMSDTISSLSQLREKAPEVYKQMMMGIATNICNDMQHAQERLKRIMRESYS